MILNINLYFFLKAFSNGTPTMKLLLVCLAGVLSYCAASKILVVYPFPGKSHSILGDGIVRNLLNAGHEVTYISVFPYEPATPKLRVIDISANLKLLPENLINIKSIMNKEVNTQEHSILLFMMREIVKTTLQYDNVQKLLNDPNETFDAVIVEWMFAELPSGLSAVFNCPFIWVASTDVHWAALRLVDQPSNPAYGGDMLDVNLPPFSFTVRVKELFTQLKVQLLSYLYFDGREKREYENVLAPIIAKRGRVAPSYYDVQFNASLVLSNSHVSMGLPIALPQNYIPIGGYHIQENVKPLPGDLKKLLDNAKDGVIYFSMGSNLKSKDLPNEIKESLLKMFSGLKQTVLWKFEEDLPNKPKNVHILKWAPQPSILYHPNTILFITHGGLLSTTETIHFGVPIIGIPVFGDQFANIIRAVKRGFALRVDLSYTMADELKSAIEEITTNSRYLNKVKELSFIYHNRPVSPGKELVHWVEHIIATRGALHLRSPALNVPFYQKLYLDLLAVILVVIFIFVKLLKLLYSMFRSDNSSLITKKRN